MNDSILYCGDTELNGAASYLAGLMTVWGWSFDYLPSYLAMTPEFLEKPHSLLILSDYPASQFDATCQKLALNQIEVGCGLLMIGGWESFHGSGGCWEGTPLGLALPVEIQSCDDRMNFDQSAWLSLTMKHPITMDLPWSARPPAIGGMNRVVAKPEASVLLNAHAFKVSTDESVGGVQTETTGWSFRSPELYPALVVGQFGSGRTAAFLSDIAPHWVGGFIDWGLPRVTGGGTSGPVIEVGSYYAQFWKQLLKWTGRREEIAR